MFACVLGGLILLLCLPVSVWVSFGGEPEFWVGWLGFKLNLEEKEKTPKQKARLEKKKAKRALKEAKKEKKVKKNTKEKKPAIKKPENVDDLTNMLGLIMDFIRVATGGAIKMLKNLRVRDLNLKITVAKYDAAETAVEYGKTSAYIFGSFAALQNYIRMKNTTIDIKPNFLIDEGSFSLSFCLVFTPLVVLWAALGILFGALWAFIKREFLKQRDKPPREETQRIKPEKVKQEA